MTESNKKTCRVIGVPQDLGQSLRGVDMGPSALRYAGLARRIRRLGLEVEDAGNISVPVRDLVPAGGGMVCLPAVTAVAGELYAAAAKAVGDGVLPLFLGGDHSISIGSVGGVTTAGRTGLLWVDAHTDVNTDQTSPSGNIHGMPLSALLGHGHPDLVGVGRPGAKIGTEDVMLIGIRDVDPGERQFLIDHGIGVYTMREIDERGMGVIAREALSRLNGCDRLHVSLDMDSLDPMVAPGVGTPVPGGLRYREAHLLMEIIADHRVMTSMDVVEVNPMLDEKNRTGTLAVELVASALGQRIL